MIQFIDRDFGQKYKIYSNNPTLKEAFFIDYSKKKTI